MSVALKQRLKHAARTRDQQTQQVSAFSHHGAQRRVAMILQHKRRVNVTHALMSNGTGRRDETDCVAAVLLTAEAHEKAARRRVGEACLRVGRRQVSCSQRRWLVMNDNGQGERLPWNHTSAHNC